MNDKNGLQSRLDDLDRMSEAIALSSPNGRMSKAARFRAEKRWVEKFGTIPFPKLPQLSKKERILNQAKNLREIAAKGMKSKAYLKKAQALEIEASNLD